MVKLPMIRIRVTRFVALGRWLTVINSICVIGFVFLTRVPKMMAVAFIIGWTITMLCSVVWGLWVFLGKVELICVRCGSSGAIRVGVGFKCMKCGYSKD